MEHHLAAAQRPRQVVRIQEISGQDFAITAQHRRNAVESAHAGQQFLQRKGLDQVVVSAGI